MAANLALAGTAIGLSHLLGLLLLLYSLEKVSGVVSRTMKRLTGKSRRAAADLAEVGASPSPGGAGHASPDLAASPSKSNHGSGLRAKGWVRGCACPVSNRGAERGGEESERRARRRFSAFGVREGAPARRCPSNCGASDLVG